MESNIFWCPQKGWDPLLLYFNSDKVLAITRKKNKTTFLSVSATRAFSEGHTQYIGDPSGIDVRSTAPAPKQSPWANSKNNRPVWAYTQALNYQQIVLWLPWKKHIPPSCSRSWASVLVIMWSGFDLSPRLTDPCPRELKFLWLQRWLIFFFVCPTGWNSFSFSF